ncbi:MAG: potassium-transporting ATPase subunit F [Thermoplasmata archaeon]|nr:potassium-transporting ATPase subunit F [Thermoplasmata archaeon]
MGLDSLVGQSIGLWVFTAITAALILYLLYAMLYPTRF